MELVLIKQENMCNDSESTEQAILHVETLIRKLAIRLQKPDCSYP